MKLAPEFLKTPLAHRGLHDIEKGRPENSRAAVQAAVDAGYGIEIDIQMSRDQQAMVFHDYDLMRLTGQLGTIQRKAASELAKIQLVGGDEGIPSISEVLAIVAGQVPLLIEIKDQDGKLGEGVGPLERALADALKGYRGPVAVMSFNPHSVADMQSFAPDIVRGLTTEDYTKSDWGLSAAFAESLTDIPDYDRVGASFVSHNKRDLNHPRIAELKAQGADILTWTVRSTAEDATARQIADNVTFEGYLPAIPA